MEEMGQYIQDVLDLIEYANGDAKTTRWGRERGQGRTSRTVHLKYIGLGNEDLITPVFEERFTMIFKAIKRKSIRKIQVVGTSGPFSEGPDYVEGWKVASKLGVPPRG